MYPDALLNRQWFGPTAIVLLGSYLLLATGCSRSDADITGQVTLDGNPVTSGHVEFFPVSGRPSRGSIDEEGRYRMTGLKKNDGGNLGRYVVTVTSRSESDDGPQYASMDDELRGVIASGSESSRAEGVRWLVPQRYSKRHTSGLTAEVTGDADIDFPLHSNPDQSTQ